MDDLTIVRLCAEAANVFLMGNKLQVNNYRLVADDGDNFYEYWPLTNKAQAMDLVIALELCIGKDSHGNRTVRHWQSGRVIKSNDLLRAISECAAKVQLAKEPGK